MMTRYGTQKDSSERYRFVPEDAVPDELLTMYYESNGLFAKIIDTPAEEAIKHGFFLDGLSDQKMEGFYSEALDELDWYETSITAMKWARLFGGSIAVLLVNDGRGLDEPLIGKTYSPLMISGFSIGLLSSPITRPCSTTTLEIRSAREAADWGCLNITRCSANTEVSRCMIAGASFFKTEFSPKTPPTPSTSYGESPNTSVSIKQFEMLKWHTEAHLNFWIDLFSRSIR